MAGRIRNKLCALAVILTSFNASAALYEIQSTGIAAGLYLDQAQAAGLFSSFGILPSGAQIKSATVEFFFQDETDGLEYLTGSSHPEIGGGWVGQAPVYVGIDVRHIHLRPYYRISTNLWRYDRESVGIYLNGASIGVAEPTLTITQTHTESPGAWEWDHGASHDYLFGYDSSGKPIIGTAYEEYYNDITYVEEATYRGNEMLFSLTHAIDSGLFASLQTGGTLDFSLNVTRGDVLFKSAALFIETFDEGAVPEPSALMLVVAGLGGIGLFRQSKRVRATTRKV